MICETCNGAGKARIKKKLFVMKGKCPSCFGSGSVCRQQIRQESRRRRRHLTAMLNDGAANVWRNIKTDGVNRQTRRDAYRATRRRNDGRPKKLAGQTRVRYGR